jgi:hypothetical protein
MGIPIFSARRLALSTIALLVSLSIIAPVLSPAHNGVAHNGVAPGNSARRCLTRVNVIPFDACGAALTQADVPGILQLQ